MSAGTLQPTIAYASSETTKEWNKLLNDESSIVAPVQKSQLMQTINFRLGSFDDDKRTFTAIASSPLLDRQGDIIDQAGWDVEHFKNNPVIPWAHDYDQPPIARAIQVGVVDGLLKFTYQAPPATMYEFADLIWNFYRNQYMFAFSVGFIPHEAQGNVLTECELLEISAVVVPANAQALALAYKSGDMDIRQAKQLAGKLKTAVKNLDDMIEASKPVEERVRKMSDTKLDITEKQLAEIIDTKIKEALAETKSAISSNLPINSDKDVSWDSGSAIANIKKWASNEDGEIDFSKYRKAFLWVDNENKDKQGGYKLPFADVFDGELKAVWRGVAAVMAVLNGSRGGVDIPDADKNAVYAQVKKYYKKFDEKVPDLKSIDDAVVTKDTIAEELMEYDVMEEKYEASHEVMELWWAFCDAYYDEETPAENLNALITELIGYLQQFVNGTYTEPGEENENDNNSGSMMDRPLHKKDAGKIKRLISEFLSKSLTDNNKEKHNKIMAGKEKDASSNNADETMKNIRDYLKDMGDMLRSHTEALNEHAETMKGHAQVIADHTAGLANLIKQIPPQEGDDSGDDDEQDKLKSTSDKTDDKTKVADKDEGEVKSDVKEQSDGADRKDKSGAKAKKEKPAAVADSGSDDEEDDNSEDDEDEDEGTTASAKGLSDNAEVDPESLTDEQAEAVIKAVNEALAKQE